MLMLIFKLGDEQYSIEAAQIVEIIPLVSIRKVPHVPDYVSGLIDYRKKIVPVIDICQLTIGRPCLSCLSTRIVVVKYLYREGDYRILGLKAENVTEIVDKPVSGFVDSCIKAEGTPYLGNVFTDESGMIQLIKIDRLISDPVSESLFNPES